MLSRCVTEIKEEKSGGVKLKIKKQETNKIQEEQWQDQKQNGEKNNNKKMKKNG